jgi:hypothetical protein
MIKFIKSFFSKKEEAPATSFNYEDVKPQAVTLTPVTEQATTAVVESIAKPAKKVAAKKPAAKKVAKPKAPKAPRAPKAPK